MQVKLLADAMLGSTARKLRAFGYDTAYFREGDDSSLVELAQSEDRVLLTADRALLARAKARGVRAVLVDEPTEGRRMEQVRDAMDDLGLTGGRGGSRCSSCNGPLEKLDRKEAFGRVPDPVARRHRLFYRCVDCEKIYWKGGHWKKLRSLGRRLDSKPSGTVTRGRKGRSLAGKGGSRSPRSRQG